MTMSEYRPHSLQTPEAIEQGAPELPMLVPVAAEDFEALERKNRHLTDAAAALCVALTQDGRVVLTERGAPFAGIGLPGGRRRRDENIRECAAREYYEETGEMLQNPQLLFIEHKTYFDEGDPKRRLSMKLGLVLGYTEEPDTLHRTKGAVAERLRIFTADRDRLPEGFVQNDLLKLGYALTYHETRAWGPLSLSQLQDLDRHLADYLVVGNIHNAGRNWIRLQPRSADTDSVYIIGSRTSEEIFPLHLIDEKAVTTLSESQNILKSSISAKPYTAETASVYFI